MTFKYTYTDSARPTSQHNFGVSESTVLVNSFVVFAKETCCVHKASIFCLLRLALLLRCSIEGSRRWAQKGGPVSCSPLLRRCLSHLSTKKEEEEEEVERKREKPLADPPIHPTSEAQVIIKMMIASRVRPLPLPLLLFFSLLPRSILSLPCRK